MSNRLHVEFRSTASEDQAGRQVAGHAAVFNSLADLGPKGLERLAPTAFDAVLKRSPDVRALVNHDPNQLLARTGNGSLRLDVDDDGLAFSLDLPQTRLGEDVREMVGSGLLHQMSFGFIPGEDAWETAPDGRQIRTHVSVRDLLDVSLVAYPAYEGTSAELRSLSSFTFTFTPAPPASPVRLILAQARLAVLS